MAEPEFIEIKLPLDSWRLIIEALKMQAEDMSDEHLNEIVEKIEIQMEDAQ
jgi:hypothetical protein